MIASLDSLFCELVTPLRKSAPSSGLERRAIGSFLDTCVHSCLTQILNLDDGILLATTYGCYTGKDGAAAYRERVPPPGTLDHNLYHSVGGSVGMCPNYTVAHDTFGLHVPLTRLSFCCTPFYL